MLRSLVGSEMCIRDRVCRYWYDSFRHLRVAPRFFWITHRRELERQSNQVLTDMMVDPSCFEVSSPIKFFNKIKRGDIKLTKADLLVIDECHHAVAPTWQRLIKEHPGPVLGLTATPWRLTKNEGFDHLFNDLVCGPQVQYLICLLYTSPSPRDS